MKLGPISKVVGVMVLGLVALGAIRLIDTIPARRLATLMGINLNAPETALTPLATPSPVPQDVARLAALVPSTVSVQTFAASSLVRSGSGTIVSSDGLIVTSSAVVPATPTTAVYQVATASGALLRARVVWRATSGIVLLKVDATDLSPATFQESSVLQAGQELQLVGALLYLSRYAPVVVPVAIPYITSDHTLTLSFDRALGATLAGTRLVDQSGRTQGLFLWANPTVRVLSAQDVNQAIEAYLVAQKK